MNKGKLMNIHSSPWQIAFKTQLFKLHAFKSSTIFPWFLLAVFLLFFAIFPTSVLAEQQQNVESGSYEAETVISEAELAQMLAPIALYPDTLLTHILIASTYPIEVIQAERWLTKHSTLTTEQLQKRAEGKGWDASVNALLPFPRVMSQLSEDLNWMQTLGDAFLQDETRVLASIQTLRQQAEQAGSLANMDNVQVIKEQQVIIIEPAQPMVIYVPYYDTRLVYGRWHWSHYPPVYWHHPYQYASHHGHFYWGHGVHISSHFFFSAFHWHNRHVVVSHYNRHGYHPRKKIVVSHNAKRWHHQPKHRRGVAYSSGSVKKKYYSPRASVRSSHGTQKNKRIKHSTSVKSKTVHTNIKGASVKGISTRNTSTGNTKMSSNSHVKQNKSIQSKPRVTNKKIVKPAVQSKQTQRASVYKYPISKPSPKPVKATKQHKSKHN